MHKKEFLNYIFRDELNKATLFILNSKVTGDLLLQLILIKLNIAILRKALIEGKISNIDEEMRLKNKLASQLLQIYTSAFENKEPNQDEKEFLKYE